MEGGVQPWRKLWPSKGSQLEKVELLSVIAFIHQINHEDFGNLANIHLPKPNTNFLNKNLNFIPNLKVYNKNEIDLDLNDFFRRIKLNMYFKDIPKIKMMTRADCSNKAKTKNGLLQIAVIQ